MIELELKAAEAVQVFLKHELDEYSQLYDGCKITESRYEDDCVYVEWQTNAVSGTFKIDEDELNSGADPDDVLMEIDTGDDCYEGVERCDSSVKYFWIAILNFPQA